MKNKQLNENFFEQIDTEAKAYFLGLMYADGCNHVGLPAISIALQERDKEILEIFKNHLGIIRNLQKVVIPPNKKFIENSTTQYRLTISSNKMSNDLTKLGCTPRKSFTLKFPTSDQVPPELIHHFIRGYFDGDGSISYGINKLQTIKSCFTIISTLEFLEVCFSKICESCQIKLPKFNHNHKFEKDKSLCKESLNCFYGTITGNKQMCRIYHYLYNNATIFLKRKKEKFLDIVNRQLPHLKPVVCKNILTGETLEFESILSAVRGTNIKYHKILKHCYYKARKIDKPDPVNNLFFSFKNEEDIYNSIQSHKK